MRRRRRTRRAEDLRRSIDCLPRDTRVAMVEALDDNTIIVGAYTDSSGGVCPRLAAHRNGGRTSLASFAHAWDRYTGATEMRQATGRELRTLRAMLEASLYYEERADHELARAASERRAAAGGEAAASPSADTGERDRTPELRRRHGWAWLRPFRRLDDYEDAVREATDPEAARREREPV